MYALLLGRKPSLTTLSFAPTLRHRYVRTDSLAKDWGGKRARAPSPPQPLTLQREIRAGERARASLFRSSRTLV